MNNNLYKNLQHHWQKVLMKWRKQRAPLLAKYDITPADRKIIMALVEHKIINKKTLALKLSLDDSSLTRSIQRLEKKQIILREISANDKRAIKLSLTTDGKRLAKKYHNASLIFFKNVLRDFNEQELNGFLNILVKIEANLESEIDDAK